MLREVGALAKDSEDLTPLGHHLAALPVDVHIGKLMLFGAIFRCIDPVLTIAAFMNSRSPFVAPLDKRYKNKTYRLSHTHSSMHFRDEANNARLKLASAKSDHLTLLSAYKGWLQAKDQGNIFQYCNEVLTFPSLLSLKKY